MKLQQNDNLNNVNKAFKNNNKNTAKRSDKKSKTKKE